MTLNANGRMKKCRLLHIQTTGEGRKEMNEDKQDSVKQSLEERNRGIVRTSAIGIVANIFLAALKAIIGIASNSIAVTLDAVNNLTDALSSVITIIGTKLAGKQPDKEHPMGHGRIEYLSALLVSALVLYAGLSSLVESVKKILHPEKASYSLLSLGIIAAAVLVKLLMGSYVKRQGKKLNSAALIASGSDASFDALLSGSVLVSALIFLFTGISLEAYVGALLSVFIVKSGYEMMRATLDEILGKRADAALTRKIRTLLTEEEAVIGAYDLFLNDYGPDRFYGTVHLELPDTMTVEEVDVLTRRLQKKVFRATGVIMVSIGVYAYNTKGDAAAEMRNEVQKLALSHEWILQLHGFYAELDKKYLQFDIVVDFSKSQKEAVEALKQEIRARYLGYTVEITADVDISD